MINPVHIQERSRTLNVDKDWGQTSTPKFKLNKS